MILLFLLLLCHDELLLQLVDEAVERGPGAGQVALVGGDALGQAQHEAVLHRVQEVGVERGVAAQILEGQSLQAGDRESSAGWLLFGIVSRAG